MSGSEGPMSSLADTRDRRLIATTVSLAFIPKHSPESQPLRDAQDADGRILL